MEIQQHPSVVVNPARVAWRRRVTRDTTRDTTLDTVRRRPAMSRFDTYGNERTRQRLWSNHWCRAERAVLAEDGRYCECAEPVLHGFDLMCGECLLENRDQIAKREARIRAPHTFEPMTDLPYMCAVCAGWEDDQRHGEASDAES
jgi:hypothetical protein